MHGFNHTLDNIGKSLVSNRNDSEFAGVSYEQQLQKILLGFRNITKTLFKCKSFFLHLLILLIETQLLRLKMLE